MEGRISSIAKSEENIHFGAEQMNYLDDGLINLCFLRLENKLDDMMQGIECRMARLESAVNEISASMKSNSKFNEDNTGQRCLNLLFNDKGSSPIRTGEDNSKFNEDNTGQRCLNLLFNDKVSSPIRTGEEIKGVGGDYIKVALVDETGNLVDSGPESSAEVHIFAFEGDVDENEGCNRGKGFFVDDVPKESKAKSLPLLVGDVELKLNNGIGLLVNIKFRSLASHVSGVFNIGARVVDHFDGIIVRDATTISFRVKDYREKYNEKHRPPFLSDEIWRLDNIGRGGNIHKCLRQQKLNTVEDFLIQFLKDSNRLKRLVDLPQTKWEATVNHALTCQLDEKVYCSISSEEENKGIVINVVGKVLGLIVAGRYLAIDELSEKEKVNVSMLDVAAFVHKNGLVPFADETSLLQQFPENASQPLNCMNMIYQEDEGSSEIGDSHQTNLGSSFEDIPLSSSQLLQIEDYFDQEFLDSLFVGYLQIDSFSDIGESSITSDGNDSEKRRRTS